MSGEIQTKFSRSKSNEESLGQKLKKAEALNKKGEWESPTQSILAFREFIPLTPSPNYDRNPQHKNTSRNYLGITR